MTAVLEQESATASVLREHGEAIRAARGRHTQRETAEAIRVSPSLLCRLENGQRRLTITTARALDRFLQTGTTFESLVTRGPVRR
jgi:transcriptional regulator with XRE-family HTH domain